MMPRPRTEPWLTDPGWDRLGGYSPYLDPDGRPLTMDFATAFAAAREPRILDAAAAVSYLAFKHLLGDRTLVTGMQRAPWMSIPGKEGAWSPLPLPAAGTLARPGEEVALALHAALLDECRGYVKGAGRVGLLLSGGMDSRIVAGVLRQVQLESGGGPDVVALTWGLPGTRDVLYAQRVADSLGWDWRHFELTPDLLRRNIHWVGRHGCEVAPVHMHAMPDIGALDDLDLVMAGSYGDSVGRAEFSGRHLTRLRPVDAAPLDPFGIVRGSILDLVRPVIGGDAALVRRHWPELEPSRVNEAGQQLHYMRRKLQTCMATALGSNPLRQLFTSSRVVNLMWELSPETRDDGVYVALLDHLDNDLASIPWARTGRAYGRDGRPEDEAPRQHHRYGAWLREDLGDEIADRAGGERVLDCGLFIPDGVRRLLDAWRRGRTSSVGLVDEIVCWLASLDVFIETYGIDGVGSGEPTFADGVRSRCGSIRAQAYTFIRSRMRD